MVVTKRKVMDFLSNHQIFGRKTDKNCETLGYFAEIHYFCIPKRLKTDKYVRRKSYFGKE